MQKEGNYLHILSGVEKHKRDMSGILLRVKEKWFKKIQSWKQIDERFIKIALNIHRLTNIELSVY